MHSFTLLLVARGSAERKMTTRALSFLSLTLSLTNNKKKLVNESFTVIVGRDSKIPTAPRTNQDCRFRYRVLLKKKIIFFMSQII